MKKKDYEAPLISWSLILSEDVIRTSGDDVGVNGNDMDGWWTNAEKL